MNRFGTQVLGLSGVRLDTYDEDSAYLELEQNARALARRREHCAQLRVELVLDYKKPIQELKRQLNARALAEPRYRPELRSFYESQATRELGLVRSWADGKALSKAEQVREARLFLARHPPSIDPGVDHPLRLLEYWGDALEYARDLHERASREQERLEWELREAVAELAKLQAMLYAPLATDAAVDVDLTTQRDAEYARESGALGARAIRLAVSIDASEDLIARLETEVARLEAAKADTAGLM
jgi:hypothetical protein